jgi:prepilin-type processing-associated H-X9-DG protein
MNGQAVGVDLTKTTQVLHPVNAIVFLEENDPRGETIESWVFTKAGTSPNYLGSGFYDSPAAYHNPNTVFGFADGHAEAHKWLDGATIQYALSMNPNKYSTPPLGSLTKDDAPWVARGYPTQGDQY